MTYNTKSEPFVNRSLSQTSRVQVSLPISVNVQDFFRGKRSDKEHPSHVSQSHILIRLFSKFTISASTQQYIRVGSATLEKGDDDSELSISGTLSQTREIIVRPQAYGTVDIAHDLLDHHPCAPRTFFVRNRLTTWSRSDPQVILPVLQTNLY